MALDLAADALVLLGLVVLTIGVRGLFRMPTLYLQLHAASKAVVFGVVALAVACVATRDAAIITRAALVSVALLLTTPVAAHAIARAEHLGEDEGES